jgi:hypothetical protein
MICYREKLEIEEGVGASLEWREMAERKSSMVVTFHVFDPYEESAWPLAQ